MDNTKTQFLEHEKKSLMKIFLVRFITLPALLGILIRIPAGTFEYWQAYVYVAALGIPMMIGLIYFLKNDPRLMERRSRPKEKEKAQVFIQTAFAILIISGYIISGLDKKYGWSEVPFNIV